MNLYQFEHKMGNFYNFAGRIIQVLNFVKQSVFRVKDGFRNVIGFDIF